MWDKTDEEWGAARTRIGGSDIGTLAGLNTYGTEFTVYASKKGFNTFEGNEATRWGNKLEGPLAEMYAEDEYVALVDWPVLFRSYEYDFMAANVDRFIVEPSEQFPAGKVTRWESLDPPPGLLAIWEGKTGGIASPGKIHEWFQGGSSIPLTYACQGAWYQAVTGLDRVEYGALLGGHGLVSRTLMRDDELISNLITIAESFWYNHIIPDIPPEADGTDTTEEALKVMYPRAIAGEVVDMDEDFLDEWNEFERLKQVEKDAIADRKAARAKIVARIGNAEAISVNGTPVCTFKNSKDGTYFAEKILEKEDPETFNKYKRPKSGFRTLRKVG